MLTGGDIPNALIHYSFPTPWGALGYFALIAMAMAPRTSRHPPAPRLIRDAGMDTARPGL
jgi:hypothetical protein